LIVNDAAQRIKLESDTIARHVWNTTVDGIQRVIAIKIFSATTFNQDSVLLPRGVEHLLA
jgi:hypothetical protein